MRDLIQYINERKELELPYFDIQLSKIEMEFIVKRDDDDIYLADEEGNTLYIYEISDILRKYRPVEIIDPFNNKWAKFRTRSKWDNRLFTVKAKYLIEYTENIESSFKEELDGWYIGIDEKTGVRNIYAKINDKFAKRIEKETSINNIPVEKDEAYGFTFKRLDTINKDDVTIEKLIELRNKYNVEQFYPLPYRGENRLYEKRVYSDKVFAGAVMGWCEDIEKEFGSSYKSISIIIPTYSERISLIFNVEGSIVSKLKKERESYDADVASWYDGNHYNGD